MAQFDLITGALSPAYKSGQVGPFTVGGDLYFAGMVEWNADGGTGLPDGSPSSMGMFKSVDGGLTWTEMDSANRVQMVDVDNLGVQLGPDTSADYTAESRFFTGVMDAPGGKYWVVYLSPSAGLPVTSLAIKGYDFTTDTWGAADVGGPAINLEALFAVLGNVGGLCTFVAGINELTGLITIGYNQAITIYYDVPPETQVITIFPYIVTWNGVWGVGALLPGIDVTTPRVPGYVRGTQWFGATSTAVNGKVHGVLLDTLQSSPADYSHVCYFLMDDGTGASGASLEVIGNPADINALYTLDNVYTPMAGVGALVYVCGFFAGEFSLAVGDSTGATTWTIIPRSTLPPPLDSEFIPNDLVGDEVAGVVAFQIDSAVGGGSLAYTTFDGVATWTAPTAIAPFSELPAGANSFNRIWPGSMNLVTGFSAIGGPYWIYGAGGGALDIVGAGDPFGGSVVPAGGKVVLVGPATVSDDPSGLIPGGSPSHFPGWPVWPPEWQAQNDYDRCLITHGKAVRRFRWQDQTRCIVWHDMDELGRMPDGGLEFYERGSIITPAPAPVDTVVLEFTVPSGYLGIIYGALFHYTGTGFEDGGGDIVWRMKVGNGWAAQGLGNCLFQLGTVGQCLSLTDYIAVNSNQRVQALVQVPNLSGNIQVGASRILATIQGWYYPL